MAAHHRYKIPVACPGCGLEGEINVMEDGGPPFSDTPRRSYAADPDRFVLIPGAEPPGLKCGACRAIFVASMLGEITDPSAPCAAEAS
jgi:hypothetical protein